MSVPGIYSKEFMPDLSLVGSHVTVLQPPGYRYQAVQSRFGSGSINVKYPVLPDISKVTTSPECVITTNRTLIHQSSTQSIIGSTRIPPNKACSEISGEESQTEPTPLEPQAGHDNEAAHKDAEPVCQPHCWKSPRSSPEDKLLNQMLRLEQLSESCQIPRHVIQSVNSHRVPLYNISLNHEKASSDRHQSWHAELLEDVNKNLSHDEESEQNEEALQDEYNGINRKLSAKNKPRKVKRKKKSHKVNTNKANWTKVRSKSAGRPCQPLSVKVSIAEHKHHDDGFRSLIMAECKSLAVLPAPIKISKPKASAVLSCQVNPSTPPKSHRLTMGTMASMSANGTSSSHSDHIRATVRKSVESLLPHHVMKSGSMPAVEQVHRIVKVFCSDKHSGVLKELGMEIPCAPPATPTPDMLSKYEYIPSLNDVRSQRAVRIRLETLEKLEKKRQEKLRDERSRREKQEFKEKEKELKKRQRLEIYALNKVMTEFENANFLDFCKKNGLNV